MKKIIVDVSTGQTEIKDLTKAEISAFNTKQKRAETERQAQIDAEKTLADKKTATLQKLSELMPDVAEEDIAEALDLA